MSSDQIKPAKSQPESTYGGSYNERLYFSFTLWLFLLGFAITFFIAIWAALGNLPAVIATLLLILLFVIMNFKSLRIQVRAGKLMVGFASIEVSRLGAISEIQELSKFQKTEVPIDPAAFLQTKFWIKPAIKINLIDPDDPTPFWLISTRNPGKLVKAISKSKSF